MISRLVGLLCVLTFGVLLAAPVARGADAPKRVAVSNESNHWAFQPIRKPGLPAVRASSWVRTPIDALVLARLEQAGIKPAAPANRRTLLRRVYLDLIGLPPSPEEQRAFLEDPSPEAYRKVVDDLLSRPQYGERWARHWLDVVRYAESNGYERDDPKPHAWRYRDYVINAFNNDKPFDRFLTEQIAGDEVGGSNAETQIATTFLRLGTWDDEPAEFTMDRYDQLDDVLGTTATAFLGITLRCARCHNHKFEPFSQVDYYRMLAVFEPLKRPEIIKSVTHRVEHERHVGTETELRTFRQASAEQLSLVAGALLPSLGGRPRFLAAPGLLFAAGHRPKEPPLAYIWYEDTPKASPTRVFRRGDPTRPMKEATPGLPEVLVKQQPDPPKPLAKSTGRRLWLARWMTSPDNPLVARVIVNRIWQHHFGTGIVASASDFGVMGDPPTHPELLDWLAADFIEGGWKMKRLHRLIVLSNTYQMSAAHQPEARARGIEKDPKDALLWHWPQRRLEAEAVRDSILAVSGRLNPKAAGPSIYPPIPRAVLEGQSKPGDGWGKSDERQASRRSIYIFVKRVLAVPELELLDSPDTTSSCEQRPVSTIAPQALTFLNGDFIQQQARYFAQRLQREAEGDPAEQVRKAFELAMCRPPQAEELRAATEFLAAQQRQIGSDARASEGRSPPVSANRRALEALCLVILNTNEFVYIN